MARFFGGKGDRLYVTGIDAIASVVLNVLALARDPKTGHMTTLAVQITSTNDRISQTINSSEKLDWDAEIVGLSVVADPSSGGPPARGQFYLIVSIGATAGGSFALARGYAYASHGLNLGDSVEPMAEAIYVENVDIANEGAAGAGTIERLYTAADDTSLELLGGLIINRDTVARRVLGQIDTGTNDQDIVTFMDDASVDAGISVSIPPQLSLSTTVGSTDSLAGLGPVIRGAKRLRLRVLSVADGQNAEFSVLMRVTGKLPVAPTRTSVGQGTEVVTINNSTLDFESD